MLAVDITIRNPPADDTLEVDFEYTIKADLDRIEVQLRDDDTTLESSANLHPYDDPVQDVPFDEYEWTAEDYSDPPSGTVRYDTENDRFLRAAGGVLAFGEMPYINALAYPTSGEPEGLGFTGDEYNVSVAGEGVAKTHYFLQGSYTRKETTVDGETIVLFITDEGEAKPDEILNLIESASQALSVGGRQTTDPIYGFIGQGNDTWGSSSGVSFMAEVFAIANRSSTSNLMLHEYVHTRQDYSAKPSLRWTTEGEASFFGSYLAWQEGSHSYTNFKSILSEGASYDSIALSNADAWRDESRENGRADYDKGALVLAALDAKIRDATGGSKSYQNVLSQLNTTDTSNRQTSDDMQAIAEDIAGISLDSFFDSYIHGTDVPEVPSKDSWPDPRGDDGGDDGGDNPPQFDAAISLSADPVDVGEEVTVSAEASSPSDSIDSYEWEFGDGGTDEGITASHTYSTAGEYTISLTVSGAEGSDTTTQQISVQKDVDVEATFTYSPQEPLVDEKVTFDGSESKPDSLDGFQFEWTFGEEASNVIGETTPYYFTSPGEYEVTLTVNPENAEDDSVSKTLTVTPVDMVAALSIETEPDQRETETDISFSAAGSTPADQINEYEWDFGDDTTTTTTEASVTHSYAEAGEYTVSVTTVGGPRGNATDTAETTLEVTDSADDEKTVEDYADPETGVVEISGFRRGIDDFIEGEIDITLFRKLIDAFISGDPVT